MGYANIQADSNFYRQSLNADGVKYVTGPYTSLYEDVFRAVTVTTDSVVSVTSYVGDSLSNQFLLAGTEIYGLFSSVTIHSGKAVLHLAGASYISEIINQYSASGIPLGFYEEGTQCLSQKISALLTQGIFDDASWVMVPSQYEEDWVRAFKPTSELGNLAFTRSSDATFTDSTGVVRRSPWNLVTFSEQFDNAAWVKLNASVSANTTTSPVGTSNADSLIENTVTNLHLTYQFFTSTAITYTYSCYIKPDTRTRVYLRTDTSVGTTRTLFDLTGAGSVVALAHASATINLVVNGWYRCTITFTEGTGAANRLFAVEGAVGTSINYTGNGLTAFYLWGAQLVEGSEALPYFATTDRLNVPRLDYRNADGTLSTCPRLLLEPQRTNSIRNSSIVGAVAGSPGTLPISWGTSNAGLTRTIVGTGTENGLPYVDVRFNGTATGIVCAIVFENASTITASVGQTWSNNVYVKNIDTTAQANQVQLTTYEYNSVGTYLVEGSTNIRPQLTTSLKRFDFVRTLTSATVARVQPLLQFALTNGTAYDFTIRIAAPQMELGAYATSWVPTTTTAVTRIADAASKTGVASLIGQTEGTWYWEGIINNTGIEFQILNSARTTSNAISITRWTNNTVRARIWSNSVLNVSIASADNVFVNTKSKIALSYKSGNTRLYYNGVLVASSAANFSFTAPIGELILSDFINYFGGSLNTNQTEQFAIFTKQLSNAECIALTTL